MMELLIKLIIGLDELSVFLIEVVIVFGEDWFQLDLCTLSVLLVDEVGFNPDVVTSLRELDSVGLQIEKHLLEPLDV